LPGSFLKKNLLNFRMDLMESAIEIKNVWKIFGNNSEEALNAIQNQRISKQEALEKYNSVIGVSDVSFNVKKGEIFCVMGLSGSGKSTLVRHINRLLEPTSGQILINNEDVMKFDSKSLQDLRNKKIGMVFQNFALMPHRSVLDNIAMPLEIRGISKNDRLDAANKILDIVELQGWGNKFAHELSGGMQQRVGLARALAADPDFLLMDEPFSALDPLIRRQLQAEFIKLSKQMKKTTVFITHDLDEAVRVGHRIAIMRDGKVIQIGTPEEIVMKPVDNYVADFVKGISRLKIVQAKSIMQPIEKFKKEFGSLAKDLESVYENDLLNKLIEKSSIKDEPILVINNDNKNVGVITQADLLKAVVEGSDGE
jgi:glycine betaine/proline transport system ATP-binding protein